MLARFAPPLLLACLVWHPLSTTLARSSQEPSPTVRVQAERDADVHNYVVTRLRLLKRGTAIEDLKAEVVNQIDFGALSPRSVDLLRKLVVLCDRAITDQAALGSKLSQLDAKAAQEDAAAGEALLKGTLGLATGGAGLFAAISALDQLVTPGSAREAKNGLLAQSAAGLGAEISAMEFDLAVLRGQIQAEGSLDASVFVAAEDYDRFLAAASEKDETKRVPGAAAALERSPRLQPAALYVANQCLLASDVDRAVQFADKTIETSPTILRRDGLRAHAYLIKAAVALRASKGETALECAARGLGDDPSSSSLLTVNADALMMLARHAEALPVYEKLVLLAPGDGRVRYNLACCTAVVKQDADSALVQFREALTRGFSDIAHAKVDPDLAVLRSQKPSEFAECTSIRLKPTMEYAVLDADDLLLTNESSFTLVNLEVAIKISGKSSDPLAGKASDWVVNKTVNVERLAPGATFRWRDVVSTTREALREIQLTAKGAAGEFAGEFTREQLDAKRRSGL